MSGKEKVSPDRYSHTDGKTRAVLFRSITKNANSVWLQSNRTKTEVTTAPQCG